MKTTNIIKKINGVEIVTVGANNLVPVKPLCEALGVDSEAQRQKIKEHYIFSSTALLSKVVAADGKEREMLCLPLGHVLGWLMTINPSNVREDVRENFANYQRECFNVLLDHFEMRSNFAERKQEEFSRQMAIVASAKENFHNAKRLLSEAESRLRKIDALTFEEFRNAGQQLTIPGFE